LSRFSYKYREDWQSIKFVLVVKFYKKDYV